MDDLDSANVREDTKTKFNETRPILERLKDECEKGFEENDVNRIEQICNDIGRLCNFLRDIKTTQNWGMPKLCLFAKRYAEDFCLSDTRCGELVGYGDGKERGFFPYLYTYLERVGVMHTYFGSYGYVTSIRNINLKAPKANNYVHLTSEFIKHNPNINTSVASIDVQNKIENAKFLRKINENCCIHEVERIGTSDGISHLKARMALTNFIDILTILSGDNRLPSSPEESVNSVPLSRSESDAASSNSSKKRVPKHLRKRR